MKKTLIVLMMVLLSAMFIVSCNNNANSPVIHKVTFDPDNNSEATVKEVNDGDTVSEPAAPTKTGYIFAGWYEGETKFESTTKITKDYSLKAKWILLPVVGDTVEYGKYPDDYDVADLKGDAVTWKVLRVDAANSRILVISENVLEKRVWNSTIISSYGDASVRTYLNDDIYNNYSLSSCKNILNVDTDGNAGSGSDHLFLLSDTEVSTYFGTNSKVASYNDKATTWWLRTCTFNSMMESYQTQYVNERGSIAEHDPTNGSLGLRPAMWVSLSN